MKILEQFLSLNISESCRAELFNLVEEELSKVKSTRRYTDRKIKELKKQQSSCFFIVPLMKCSNTV